MPRPTDEELAAAENLAVENDGRWSGMTYEQGVAATIQWVQGNGDNPMIEN